MLYSPNNHRFAFGGLPHAYVAHRAPPQPVKKKGHNLGWLFSLVGMIVADIVINIAFAVIDVVVGVFTAGAGDVPLLAGEEIADDALFGAEAGAETAEASSEAADAAGQAEQVTSTVSGRFAKRVIKKGAKAFFGKTLKTDVSKFSSSLVGRVLKPLLQGVAYQASSGISYNSETKKFGYNRAVWKSPYNYLFNFLFVGSAIFRGISKSFGRATFTTFQKWFAQNSSRVSPEFRKAYKEVLKTLLKHNKDVGSVITVGKQVGFGMAYLLRHYKELGLSDEEILSVEAFMKGLQDSNLVGFGRVYLRVVKIYAKIFTFTPKTAIGRKIRDVYDFFFKIETKAVFIKSAKFNTLFSKFFKEYSKGKYFETSFKEWSESIAGLEARKKAFSNYIRRFGAQAVYQGVGKSRRFIGFEIKIERGIVGKLLSNLKSTERYLEYHLTREKFNSREFFSIRSPIRSWINYTYGLSAGAYIDAFESYIFQFVTSPFYALDYLAFKIPRLLQLNKLIRYYFERSVSKKIDKVFDRFWDEQLTKKFRTTFITNKFAQYASRQISREQAIRDIFLSEERKLFFKTPNEYFEEFISKRLLSLRNNKIIRKTFLLEGKQEGRWTKEMMLKKLRGLPNFIEFRYSSILGVVFQSNTLSREFNKEDIVASGVLENEYFTNSLVIAWTIFFAPVCRKPSIYQASVPRKIAKAFVKSGLTNAPPPWVYYNKFIAWGSEITKFGHNVTRGIFRSLPHTIGPLRFYAMDVTSLQETIQHNEYQKLFTGKKLQPKQLEKIAGYGAFKNLGGLLSHNRYLGVFRLQSLGGTFSSSFINSLHSKRVQTAHFGRRVTKLTYYKFARA